MKTPATDMKMLEDLNSEWLSLRRIESFISNLTVSAEVKVILSELSISIVNVGGRTYRIGRKVIEIAIVLGKIFREITFTLIVATFSRMLIAVIPVLGPVLATAVGPMMFTAACKDIANPELKERMKELVCKIKELFSAPETPNPA